MRWVLGSLLLLLFNACANIVPPDGGAKDQTPPRLIRVTPPDQSVGQRPDRLVFEFDEYVQVKDPSLVRWGLVPRGRNELRTRLKRVYLILDSDSLEEASTYSVDLGGAVSDLTEGNVLSKLTYAFSTGTYLDSLSLQGRIRDARSGMPVKNLTVGLYADRSESVMPLRWTLADDSGRFVFRNLPTRIYRLVAFEDPERDKVYGPDQPKAFTGFLDPTVDTAVLLPLFAQDEEASTRLRRWKWSDDGSLALVFYGKPYAIKVRAVNEDGLLIYGAQTRVSGDTLWVSVPPQGESSFALRVVFPQGTDTLLTELHSQEEGMDPKQEALGRVMGPKVVSWGPAVHAMERRLVWDRPVHYQDGKSLACWQHAQKGEKAVVWKRDAEGRTPYGSAGKEWYALAPETDKKLAAEWRLRVDSGAFVDGNDRESGPYQADWGQEGERAALVLGLDTALDEWDRSGSLVLSVWTMDDQLVERLVYKSREEGLTLHALEGILPGLYKVSVLEDRNNNGEWDAGRYREGRQPETVRWISRNLELKPGWTTELRWR